MLRSPTLITYHSWHESRVFRFIHGLFDQHYRLREGDRIIGHVDGEMSHDQVTRFLSERKY
ncbi:hypothetical protein, partial [Nitrosomonas communis]